MTRFPTRAFPASAVLVGLSRAGALLAVVMVIGMLPWLSGQSPEYTVLRARYADLEDRKSVV